jgi:hypothetical protein
MQHTSSVPSSLFQCNDLDKVYIDFEIMITVSTEKTVFIIGSNLVDIMMITIFCGVALFSSCCNYLLYHNY